MLRELRRELYRKLDTAVDAKLEGTIPAMRRDPRLRCTWRRKESSPAYRTACSKCSRPYSRPLALTVHYSASLVYEAAYLRLAFFIGQVGQLLQLVKDYLTNFLAAFLTAFLALSPSVSLCQHIETLHSGICERACNDDHPPHPKSDVG